MTNEIILSILICSLHKRIDNLRDLLSVLSPQIDSKKSVELIINTDNKTSSTGRKRQLLLEQAKGKYIVFIDDDDHIDSQYVHLILEAVKSSPDCVATNGWYTDNGKTTNWYLSKDLENENKNGVFYRTTNHISPVKRELALLAGFPDISFGEDAEYSKRLRPLLKTETRIDKLIYHYDFKNHNKEY